MSHFTVLVFGNENEVGKLLEKFDENISFPPYVEYTKQQLIDKKRKDLEGYKSSSFYLDYTKNPEEYKKNCSNIAHIDYLENIYPSKLQWDDEQIYQDAIEGYDKESVGQNGEVYSTYNPDSKWDWYSVGGRWAGSILNNCCKKDDLPKDFVPFAFVDQNGDWHEKGEMGWWALVDNEKEENDWEEEFKNAIDNYNGYVTLVDCHI
jgi:hypothetical protein